MTTDGPGRMLSALVAVLALLWAASGSGREYRPIKVPIIPGVRKIVERDQAKRLKPYLENAGGDILFASDLSSEVNRGATNSAAALGNGGLSVLISPWGELTVLRWPSPLFGDQLRYYTLPGREGRPVRMGREAPSLDWRRYGHPQDACPGLGSRAGLALSENETVWLGDPSWISRRAFEPENSMTLVTTLTRPGWEAVITDFVDPDRDLLIRNFKITGPATRFLYHASFAPRVPDPAEGADWDPADAGFAAAFLADDQIIVHFQPRAGGRRPPAPLRFAPASAADLDAAYPEGGAFVAWGLMTPASSFQVGADRCGRDLSPDAPAGGWDDAADGSLSGSMFFNGPVNAALGYDLAGSGSGSEVTVVIAVGGSAGEAAALIGAARSEGFASLRSRCEGHWTSVADKVYVPAGADAVARRVLTRSALNVVMGQDRESGAIVASVSRQPPYHFDYPRDGAFFDLLLDLAGFPAAVSFHHDFLARTQYRNKLGFAVVWMVNFRSPFFDPSGNWPQKMSVDGSSPTNFLINPCEIDETALTVWNFWRHERVLPPESRAEYVEALRETLARSADSLVTQVDLRQGWTRPATEDDSFPPDATLHGASSTLTALAAACDAGPRWGLDPAKTDKYCEAARSLREGIRGRTVFPETLDHAGFRGLAWTLWPAPAFDDYTEPGAAAIKERLAASIRSKVSKEGPGFAYLGEEMAALALADRERGEYRDLLESALALLTREAAFPGTDCFGEITVWGDFAGTGERVAQQRTAIPHLWNGATVYLAALAIYRPDLLDPLRPPAP